MDIPVQYFQSVIAMELAVAGALLWQIHYFESRDAPRRDGEPAPSAWLRLGLALVLPLEACAVALSVVRSARGKVGRQPWRERALGADKPSTCWKFCQPCDPHSRVAWAVERPASAASARELRRHRFT
jgi:hypothetical protein